MRSNSLDLGPFGRSMKAKLAMRAAVVVLTASASLTWCLLAMSNNGPVVDPSKNNMALNAPASTPFVDIASAGPLTHVYLGNELSCQVRHVDDGTTGEFYPPGTIPGDCGTFIAMGGTLYAPDFNGHGGTATSGIGARVIYTPVSQTGITGTGTAADPFKVVTVVDVSTTGLRIQQTDSYVIGDESYRTDIMLTNSGSPASGVLYRAADAFLGGSDSGYGFTEIFGTRKAVGCAVNSNNNPPGRIEEWVPLTGGNNFYQNHYNSVWTFIATKAPFPDTCGCATFQDNGGGISWNFSIPTAGSATYSHVTTFSPVGRQALVTSKTADSGTSLLGLQNGYTITIQNANVDSVTLNSITDRLPAGFRYVLGSTSGVTTSAPSVSGQMLAWSGPFVVAPNSSVSLHLRVIVAITPGDYFNEAGGEAAGGYTVAGTGPTARITVSGLLPQVYIKVSPTRVTQGQNATFTVVSLSGPVLQPVTVTYSMSGTAHVGSDYTMSGTFGQITIPVGQSSGAVTFHALTSVKKTASMALTNGVGYVISPSRINKASVTIWYPY